MIYNFVFYIYELGVFIASFFSEKVKKMWHGERNAFKILKEKVDASADYAWFHAASLGEFEQGRPIIEEFRRTYPEKKVLLTFFSPSGYEVRKDYEHADIVCYLPIDTPTNAIRFLRLIRPSVAFFIKYEFWYNYLHILRHRNVPVYSVSSIFRKNQIFFKWYGCQYRHVLNCFTHFFVQNEQSKELLHGIGLDNVDVTGDTRFDRVLQISRNSKQISEIEVFKGDSKVFIAGSSWLPDEQIFTPYFMSRKDWKMIIAPHVISEEHISQLLELLKGRKVVRYSKLTADDAKSLKDMEVMIIDCFGLLSSIYRYGDVAYVGGGFGVGIHNLPEAAVWGMPVIFGPNNEKFKEAQELKECGGGYEVKDYNSFSSVMDNFISNVDILHKAAEASGNYVKIHSGATERLLSLIKESKNK